jgi:hypothetical protein
MKLVNTLTTIACTLLVLVFISTTTLFAQANTSKQRILVDVAHGQKFWNDPSAMAGQDSGKVARINYMNGELVKNAKSLKADVTYLKGKITHGDLTKNDVLFIHIPSSKYEADEVKVIQQHLEKGGSLFLVMDADYWSTLEQTNVNDILSPFNLQFGGNSSLDLTGGQTKTGAVTKKNFSIPFHGARTVQGGTPFCFNNENEQDPFGTYIELKNGGKIIAMADGMVSLYMTSWEGVNNYQCSEFMNDSFAWLLK